jgi:hypothetical protein
VLTCIVAPLHSGVRELVREEGVEHREHSRVDEPVELHHHPARGFGHRCRIGVGPIWRARDVVECAADGAHAKVRGPAEELVVSPPRRNVP